MRKNLIHLPGKPAGVLLRFCGTKPGFRIWSIAIAILFGLAMIALENIAVTMTCNLPCDILSLSWALR
jgi:hypothetical protein